MILILLANRPSSISILQGLFQPGTGFDAVHFGGGEQGGEVRPPPSDPANKRIFAVLVWGPMARSTNVGVGITDGLCQFGFSRDARKLPIRHGEQFSHDWMARMLALSWASPSADVLLDGPERP